MLNQGEKRALLDLCRRFLATNSTSPVGTVKLAHLAGHELKQLGFKIRYQRGLLAGANQLNLIAELPHRIRRSLLLNTHLDTVTTDESAWTKTGGDPWNPMLRQGQLYGLGAADTKLALACQVIALQGLDLKHLNRALTVTGSYGEEMGLVGVQQLIKDKKLKPAYVLNSEPTELMPSNGNFGFSIHSWALKEDKQWARASSGQLYKHVLRFEGKAAHSACPEKGFSALLAAFSWLHDHKQVQLCEFHGGLASNIVAPTCRVKIVSTRRVLSGLKKYRAQCVHTQSVTRAAYYPIAADFVRGIYELIHTNGLSSTEAKQSYNLGTIHLKAGELALLLSHRFSRDQQRTVFMHKSKRYRDHFKRTQQTRLLDWVLSKDNAPFYQDPTCSFVKSVQSVIRGLKYKSRLLIKPGCTEAMFFARLGCDVLTVGPGVSYGNIHAPNESVAVEQLQAAVIFYRKIIQRLCG